MAVSVETKSDEIGGPCWIRTSDQWIKSLPVVPSRISGLRTPSLPNLPFFYGNSRGVQPQR